MALGMTYVRAIERAGGMPVVLPPAVDDVEALLERLDGICLSGGPDLDPAAYGDPERHVELGPTEPSLDSFELALARAADAHGVPLLGVAAGPGAQRRPRRDPAPAPARPPPGRARLDLHAPVEVEAGTRLARIVGAGRMDVNSFHHQAIDVLGAGLRVSAVAPDGTIEAIEGDGRFVLGVQWHAETLAGAPLQLALFEALVQAAGAARGLLAAA